MANLVEKLRKENNKNDKLLSKENTLIMTDIVVYMRSSDLSDYDIEVIRRELYGMIYEAQLRNKSASQVIGDDYKSFCEELMKSGREKGAYEKFLERAYIGVVGIGVLFAIEFVFSGFIFELFIHRNVSMPISAGFLVSTIMIIIAALLIYWFFTKHSFELSVKGLSKYKVFFVVGFALFFTGTILCNVFLGDYNLFKVNVFIPIGFFTIAYLIVKLLGDRNANRIAATHK